MRYSVSDTAEYGDMTRGPRIIDDYVKDEMREILREYRTGLSRVNGFLSARPISRCSTP